MTDDRPLDVDARAAAFRVPPPRRGGRLAGLALLVLAVLWAAVWGAAAAAWAELPVPPAGVALLTFLPGLAGALAGAAFLLWTAVPDRVAAAALAVACALPPLVWWGPGLRGAPVDPDGEPVRVVTWNVRRLWGLPEAERPSLDCVVDTLRGLGPHALALQEVTAADVEALDAALGLDCVWATYRARHRADDAGLAVCAVDGATRLVEGRARSYTADEDWRWIDARLERSGLDLRVLGVHLAPMRLLDEGMEAIPEAAMRLPSVTAAHAVEAHALREAVAGARATVLAGDFNSAPDTPLHAHLRRALRDTWAVGHAGPRGTVRLFGWLPLRIDHVYVSPDVGVVDATIPDTACSDHRPVVADLSLDR